MTTKDLEQRIRAMAAKKSMDTKPVFVDFLDYIIGYFDPDGTPIEGWASKYTKEDNRDFHAMMCDYFTLMQEELNRHEWYDAFGDLFMSLNVGGNDKGQFFTPSDLCDLLAQNTIDANGKEPTARRVTTFGRRVTINDAASGSSRTLLAANAIFVRNKWAKPYLVAEDLDATCCKMSAINMAVHGCFGEVVQHNTLSEPHTAHAGYIINETMWPFPTGIPSIRRCDDARRLLATSVGAEKENAPERKEMPPTAKTENPTTLQLNLF